MKNNLFYYYINEIHREVGSTIHETMKIKGAFFLFKFLDTGKENLCPVGKILIMLPVFQKHVEKYMFFHPSVIFIKSFR